MCSAATSKILSGSNQTIQGKLIHLSKLRLSIINLHFESNKRACTREDLAKKNHAIWSKNEEIGLEIGGSGGAIFFEGDNNFDSFICYLPLAIKNVKKIKISESTNTESSYGWRKQNQLIIRKTTKPICWTNAGTYSCELTRTYCIKNEKESVVLVFRKMMLLFFNNGFPSNTTAEPSI